MTAEHSSPETATRVLRYLEQHETASCRQIAGALGIGRSTAMRAIHRLIGDGVLMVARRGTGAGYPTTYRLIDPGQ